MVHPYGNQFVEKATGAIRTANSLFRKILPVSPFDPRFCPDKLRYPILNLNGIRILRKEKKKNQMPIPPIEAFGSTPEPPLLEFHLLSLHAA
jgi:hypothetical protein